MWLGMTEAVVTFRLNSSSDRDVGRVGLVPLVSVVLMLVVVFLLATAILGPAIPLRLPGADTRIGRAPPRTVRVDVSGSTKVF